MLSSLGPETACWCASRPLPVSLCGTAEARLLEGVQTIRVLSPESEPRLLLRERLTQVSPCEIQSGESLTPKPWRWGGGNEQVFSAPAPRICGNSSLTPLLDGCQVFYRQQPQRVECPVSQVIKLKFREAKPVTPSLAIRITGEFLNAHSRLHLRSTEPELSCLRSKVTYLPSGTRGRHLRQLEPGAPCSQVPICFQDPESHGLLTIDARGAPASAVPTAPESGSKPACGKSTLLATSYNPPA